MKPQISIVMLTYKGGGILIFAVQYIREIMGNIVPYMFILVDNNTDGVRRGGILAGITNVVYIDEGFNMGIAGGRNRGVREAEGDIVVFLDDKAFLKVEPGFASNICNNFSCSQDLAVITFRNLVESSGLEDSMQFSHANKKLNHEVPFDTFRFMGDGHAIRLSHLKGIGLYCPAFFYGMEEFDLSYRFLKAGYRIEYHPDYCVQHMKQESGRLPSKEVVQRMYANKLAVAWMHLPIEYFIGCGAAWFIKTAKDARSLNIPIKSISDFLAMASHGKLLPRRPSHALVDKIKQLGGIAWR